MSNGQLILNVFLRSQHSIQGKYVALKLFVSLLQVLVGNVQFIIGQLLVLTVTFMLSLNLPDTRFKLQPLVLYLLELVLHLFAMLAVEICKLVLMGLPDVDSFSL